MWRRSRRWERLKEALSPVKNRLSKDPADLDVKHSCEYPSQMSSGLNEAENVQEVVLAIPITE